MKVKIFDFEHEQDLEEAINLFLEDQEIKINSIKYAVSHFYSLNEQVFSFSALILYEKAVSNL
jgi:hypothetical protein